MLAAEEDGLRSRLTTTRRAADGFLTEGLEVEVTASGSAVPPVEVRTGLVGGASDGDFGSRLEDTPAGRRVVSAFVTVLLAAALLSAASSHGLVNLSQRVYLPITDATGLSQHWSLFAPDPRSTTYQLEARLTYADGTTDRWRPPTGDRFLGVYRGFRWRKWANHVLDGGNQDLWRPAAAYIAGENRRDGVFPVEVTLVHLRYDAPEPGSGQPRDPSPTWEEQPFYTLQGTAEGMVTGERYWEDEGR